MERIVLRNVHKAYDHPVLTGLDAAFEPGGVYAVMGPSGCGKTTLLRVIAGLEPADSGSIEGTGQAVISFDFQEDRLLEHLSGVGNIRFAVPGADPAQIRADLAALQISSAEAEKPVRDYSGGMKRRIAFLRSLLYPSDLLLLDEPFKGLDEENVKLAISFLLKRKGDRTVIFTTHDPKEAQESGAGIFHL